MTTQEVDILDALADLVRQAITERSHYYVASIAKQAAMSIVMLRVRVKILENECARLKTP